MSRQEVIMICFTITVTLAIFAVGYLINITLKANEVELKYIDISVNILSSYPSEDQKNLRLWAVDNINEYSKIKLSMEARKELIAKPLSFDDSEFSIKLRQWLDADPGVNKTILKSWLKTRNIRHSVDTFLNLELYEEERYNFLKENVFRQ